MDKNINYRFISPDTIKPEIKEKNHGAILQSLYAIRMNIDHIERLTFEMYVDQKDQKFIDDLKEIKKEFGIIMATWEERKNGNNHA